MRRTTTRHLLQIVFFLLVTFSANAQSEINFTNIVSFTKTRSMNDVRLVALIPAPVTNEYQEISSLQANLGRFIILNEANKVLFYDGPFEDKTMDVFESFRYKTKKIKIDFTNKSNKNIVTGVNPNVFLGRFANANLHRFSLGRYFVVVMLLRGCGYVFTGYCGNIQN